MFNWQDFSPIGVLGVGRLGSVLATSLVQSGMVVMVHDQGGTCIGFQNRSMEDLVTQCPLIFLTVNDDQILQVGQHLKALFEPLTPRKRAIIICSGSFSLNLLDELHISQCQTAKLHPLQSFPDRRFQPFESGIPWAIQAQQPLQGALKELVQLWKGESYELKEDQWDFYHLAAVLSSNFLPLFIRKGIEIMGKTGVSEEECAKWLAPLVQKSVQKGLDTSLKLPFSGPASRLDRGVIEAHVNLLSSNQEEWGNRWDYLYETCSSLIADMQEKMKEQ